MNNMKIMTKVWKYWKYLQSLYNRGIALCENFAENTTKYEKLNSMFPRNNNESKTRNPEQFKVNMAFTERYKKNSYVPYMQRWLNKLHKEKDHKIPLINHT